MYTVVITYDDMERDEINNYGRLTSGEPTILLNQKIMELG